MGKKFDIEFDRARYQPSVDLDLLITRLQNIRKNATKHGHKTVRVRDRNLASIWLEFMVEEKEGEK